MQSYSAPDFIDDAKVLKWAWSGERPFGHIKYADSEKQEEVYGLAICQYENEESFYRFSCDKNWETLQDGLYDSIEDAIDKLPIQYRNVEAVWQTK